MTTPTSSDDFFTSMGTSPPAKPSRPLGASSAATSRPPPPRPAGATGAPPARRAPPPGARSTATGARPTTAGRTGTAGRTATRPAGTAGRTAGRTSSAGRTIATGGASTAGRASAGRTSSAGRSTTGARGAGGRGTAGRARSTAGRGTRPVGSTASGATHLTSRSTANPYAAGAAPAASNPYAAGAAAPAASSSDWFSTPTSTQQQQPIANQWQQPSAQAPVANQWQQPAAVSTNQWQQPSAMQPQEEKQPQQPAQNLGSNFFLNGAMSQNNSNGSLSSTGAPQNANYAAYDMENEPPLLEELGVNIDHIWTKTKAVILPFQKLHGQRIHLDPAIIKEDADLAGPLMFALALGGELLMTGKLHFGFIYGIGLFGCFSMTLILNLMTPQEAISVWTVASILGYSLLPVNLLALVKIVLVNLIGLETFGRFLALLAILWSTVASTRLLEVGCGMRSQRYLIGYPIALLYSAFVLMTIF